MNKLMQCFPSANTSWVRTTEYNCI